MTTIRETYTIPKDIVKSLNEYSTKTMIPKSRLVAQLIKNYLAKNEKK